jgi:hypothetical protein
VVEKKLLAIVWGIKYIRPYLYGRNFKIVSDHKHLTWIMNVKGTGSRLLRWKIRLEDYGYEIIYKPGAQNLNAHALARINSIVWGGGKIAIRKPLMKMQRLKF